MLIKDTTKKITIWYNSVRNHQFCKFRREEKNTTIYMQEQNFNQTQAGGYNPVLFQHLTQEEIQLYTIQVLMTLKRYRFTGKIVDTPPLLFFNTRDTFTTNISCKNESPK